MIWNVPNLLTLGRLILIPLFVIAYYLPYACSNELAAVSFVGKIKTSSQMLAIPFLLWRDPLPILRVGEFLLYVAAGLTLWSMLSYLRIAWVDLVRPEDDENRR